MSAPSTKTTSSFTSPSFLSPGNLTLKGIDVENTSYPVSDLRTSLLALPFPHPKYHVQPNTNEIYEVESPIFEEYDPVRGFIGSVGEIRESIEGGDWSGWLDVGEGLDRWKGYVEWPESGVRSSIKREEDWGRMEGKEGKTESEGRVKRRKRLKLK